MDFCMTFRLRVHMMEAFVSFYYLSEGFCQGFGEFLRTLPGLSLSQEFYPATLTESDDYPFHAFSNWATAWRRSRVFPT